jgi:hypothetical protein
MKIQDLVLLLVALIGLAGAVAAAIISAIGIIVSALVGRDKSE